MGFWHFDKISMAVQRTYTHNITLSFFIDKVFLDIMFSKEITHPDISRSQGNSSLNVINLS